MEIRPTGGAPPLGVARVPDISPADIRPQIPMEDSAESLLADFPSLSAADLLALVSTQHRPDLLATLLNAAEQDDVSRVLETFEQMTKLDPEQAQAVPAHPSLQALRPQVEAALHRAVAMMKMTSESKLAEAEHAVSDKTDHPMIPKVRAHPAEVLTLSKALHESGGLTNYIHSADLSQIVIDALRFAPVPKQGGTQRVWSQRKQVTKEPLPWILVIALAMLVLLWRC